MPFVSSRPVKVGRPPKQPLWYAVTFESVTNAPLTITGQILASNPARSMYLAVRDARNRAKGVRWNSLAVVLTKDGPIGPASPSL